MEKKENWALSERGRKTNRLMLVIIFLALLFVLVIGTTQENNSPTFSSEDLLWNDGWLLPDGTELSLPCADKTHNSLTIRKILPQGLTNQDCLVFSSAYQPLRVEVNGERLPVIGTFDGRLVYAAAYGRVRLSPEMSGKEIQVTFLNQGTKLWMEIYSIKLGDYDLIRQAAFTHDSVSLFSAVILLVTSILVFIMSFFLRKSAIQMLKNHTQLCLSGSLLALIFSIWMLVDTEFVTLQFGGNPAYIFVNLFSYLFIIGPWLMQIMFTSRKSNPLLRFLATAGLIETATVMVGVVFGYFNYSIYMTVSHMISTGVLTATICLSFIEFRQRRDLGSILLFSASILMVIMGGITTLVYYFAVSPNNISYLKYGIFCYILMMLYDLLTTFNSLNKRYVREMEAARLAAVEANRAKSEFLSSMSHDIRTPMNAIMGLTTIATANIDNKETVRDALRKITLSSRHLLGLINDILDMSKIESGKVSLTMEDISLRELMENLLNIIQPQIKSRRQKFDIIIEDISCENIYCDGVRLNQVILNLLSNAVKFTPEEGSICVTLRQEASPKGEKWIRTSFQVTDSGIGMTQEFVQQIFDKFSRADNYHVHATEGSGLGMSITKHIVDMMDGNIHVESRLGEGSSFLVTLDLERVTQQEMNRILPPWNTLVVDDDKPLCLSAVETLREMGIQADWTLSGEDAVDMVDRRSHSLQPYHVVLLDWQMPGMDGIETARRIRERVGDGVPILLITAYDWSEIEQEAREAGVNGFLAKPLFQSTLRCGLLHYVGEDANLSEPEREEIIDWSGCRLLVAEDDDINWEIDEEILSGKGFLVDRAENGQECLRIFQESEPGYYDMILMDVRMPQMNGYQCTTAIRTLPRADAASVPILAMTADAFSEDVQHCLAVGMNGHIAKPLDFKNLLRLIRNYITPKD